MLNFNITGTLGLILVLFSLASILAGVAGYFKAGTAKSRIEAADADIARWAARYAALEGDRARDVNLERTARRVVEESLATANQRIQNLADVIHAQDTLNEIKAALERHDETIKSEILAHDTRAERVERIMVDIGRRVGVRVSDDD